MATRIGRKGKAAGAARGKGTVGKAKKPVARPAAKAAPAVRPSPKASAKATAKAKVRAAVSRPRTPKKPEAGGLKLIGLSPSFTVNDLSESIRFYVDALGFTVKHRWERDGELRGVQIVAGRSEVSLGQDDWAKGRDRVKGVGFRIYAETTQDLSALAERIRAHGFAAEGPKKESWGPTTVSVTDPDGFAITFHDPMD